MRKLFAILTCIIVIFSAVAAAYSGSASAQEVSLEEKHESNKAQPEDSSGLAEGITAIIQRTIGRLLG